MCEIFACPRWVCLCILFGLPSEYQFIRRTKNNEQCGEHSKRLPTKKILWTLLIGGMSFSHPFQHMTLSVTYTNALFSWTLLGMLLALQPNLPTDGTTNSPANVLILGQGCVVALRMLVTKTYTIHLHLWDTQNILTRCGECGRPLESRVVTLPVF